MIPNRMEETKVPRVNNITEVDLDNDEAPPSTPCLMREIQHVLDQDVARSVTHKPMTEVRIFALEVEAPENESEAEEQEHDSNTKEKENYATENHTDNDEVTSECESVSTVGYSRAETRMSWKNQNMRKRMKKSSSLMKRKLM